MADSLVSPLEMVARMKELFLLRPVWTTRQFSFNSLLGQRYWVLKEAMPYNAYFTSNGPMGKLWSHWGYDPALDAKSRHYMVVQFRMNIPEYERLNARICTAMQKKGIESNGLGLGISLDTLAWVETELGDQLTAELNDSIPFLMFGGSVIRKRFMQVQPCNVPFPAIIDFFRKAKILPVWNAETGWYSPEALKYLRLLLLQTFNDRVDELLENIPPLPKGSIAQPTEELGFPVSMFTTQAIYDAIPEDTAQSLKEVEENNRLLKPLIRQETMQKFKPQLQKRVRSSIVDGTVVKKHRKKAKVEQPPPWVTTADAATKASTAEEERPAQDSQVSAIPSTLLDIMPVPMPVSVTVVPGIPKQAISAALPRAPVIAPVTAKMPQAKKVTAATVQKSVKSAKAPSPPAPSAQQMIHSQIEASQPFGMVFSSGSEYESNFEDSSEDEDS